MTSYAIKSLSAVLEDSCEVVTTAYFKLSGLRLGRVESMFAAAVLRGGGDCSRFKRHGAQATVFLHHHISATASMLLPAIRQSCAARQSTVALSAVQAGKQRW